MNYEVPAEHLQDVWPKCRHWIERALEYGPGDEQLSDVFLGIARGMYGLWTDPVKKWAAVYQILCYPRQTVCTVIYCGGDDLYSVKEVWEVAKEECRRRGVHALRMWGREGWERALDVRRIGVILQHDLATIKHQKSLSQPDLRTVQ